MEPQLGKWMAQTEKPVSPSRSWYWHRLHYRLDRLVRESVAGIGERGVMLDYGGGLAPLSRHWHRDFPGWQVILSDLSEGDLHSVGLLDSPMPRVVLHADQDAIRPGSLDIVYCSEVVEHLPEPQKLLADFHRWLRPGGVLVMSTPNGGHPLVKSEAGVQQGSGELLATNAVGFGHISVHPTRQWIGWLEAIGFANVTPSRGALLFGGPKWDTAPRLAAVMAAEMVLDMFNAWNWSESCIVRAVKS